MEAGHGTGSASLGGIPRGGSSERRRPRRAGIKDGAGTGGGTKDKQRFCCGRRKRRRGKLQERADYRSGEEPQELNLERGRARGRWEVGHAEGGSLWCRAGLGPRGKGFAEPSCS